MKKRILSMLLALLMVVSLAPMSALADKSDTDIAYAVDDGNIYFDKATGTITGSDRWVTQVIIPAEIEGEAVTSIGDSAFSGCASLESVTISNSVTSIGYRTFSSCTSLKSVTIPDSVTRIGNYAFSSCTSLESVTMTGVTSIGESAFYDCASLKNVTLSANLSSIGDDAFDGCTSLTIVTIPDGVTSIGDWAFRDCTSLTSVTIPDSVASIGGGAFDGCTSLTSIEIPSGVTSIGEYAFSECTSLEKVTIPDSVTEIGESAFAYCNKITDVYYSGSEEQWEQISIQSDNDPLLNATIHYAGSCPAYDIELKNAKNATCTETGYTGDKVCTVCGETVKKGTEIAALGHKFENGVCTVCGAADPDYVVPNPFKDVEESSPYYDAIIWAANEGVTTGKTTDTFGVNDGCTRGQIVTFLFRASGDEKVATGVDLTDVAAGSYCADAVAWAVANEITNGFADGTFRPEATCTRGQAVTFIYRALAE